MPSAKSARVAKSGHLRNLPLRTKAKTYVTRTRSAIEAGDAAAAEQNAKAAIVALDKAVQKGALHKANAARRKSRLMRQFNASKKKA
ncbi:MAG: 30S ribosomal protein S20 [SAR202 cluster bacterium]|nr:30S ribosomal protein S20 [SAR202 cluster bacterium]